MGGRPAKWVCVGIRRSGCRMGMIADREIVLAAVAQDGKHFKFASKLLKNDLSFVCEVLRGSDRFVRFKKLDVHAREKIYCNCQERQRMFRSKNFASVNRII